MTGRLAAALAALSLAGCYTIRYERRSALPEPGTPKETTHHGFVGGLIAGSPVDLKAMCPSGVASVESQITPLDWGPRPSPPSSACSCRSGRRSGSRPRSPSPAPGPAPSEPPPESHEK